MIQDLSLSSGTTDPVVWVGKRLARFYVTGNTVNVTIRFTDNRDGTTHDIGMKAPSGATAPVIDLRRAELANVRSIQIVRGSATALTIWATPAGV